MAWMVLSPNAWMKWGQNLALRESVCVRFRTKHLGSCAHFWKSSRNQPRASPSASSPRAFLRRIGRCHRVRTIVKESFAVFRKADNVRSIVFLFSIFWGLLAGAAPERPNIVFILTDDMGYGDLGCYGGTIVPTPNIDRLGQEGTRFTQFYVASPVCSPSR